MSDELTRTEEGFEFPEHLVRSFGRLFQRELSAASEDADDELAFGQAAIAVTQVVLEAIAVVIDQDSEGADDNDADGS